MSTTTVTKVYPERAHLTLYRHAGLQTFHCCRCGNEKKSKLAAALEENFGALVCNACYGWFLSRGEGDFTVFEKGRFEKAQAPLTENAQAIQRKANPMGSGRGLSANPMGSGRGLWINS